MSTESISNLPRVALYSLILGKFIVVELRDADNRMELVVRGGDVLQYHENILNGLLTESTPLGLSANCIGGGKFVVNHGDRTILLWSQSGDYGKEPNRKQTVELFQTSFPGFIVSEMSTLQVFELELEL